MPWHNLKNPQVRDLAWAGFSPTLLQFLGDTLSGRLGIYYERLELAVKLYLGVPGEGYWLGPGGKDRLDLKLGHLLQKQIQLGTQAAAQKVLADYGVDDFTTAIDFTG